MGRRCGAIRRRAAMTLLMALLTILGGILASRLRVDSDILALMPEKDGSATPDVDALSVGRITVVGVSFGEANELAELLSTVQKQVLPLVLDGRIHPIIHAVLPFAEANEAVAMVRTNRAVGSRA